MDEIQSYRMHPKMTKGLLDQIDNLQKTNHTTDEIAATLGITPEAVERGFEKLADRKKTLAHSLRGGAFAVVMRAEASACLQRKELPVALQCERLLRVAFLLQADNYIEAYLSYLE